MEQRQSSSDATTPASEPKFCQTCGQADQRRQPELDPQKYCDACDVVGVCACQLQEQASRVAGTLTKEGVVISVLWEPGMTLKTLKDQVVEAAFQYCGENAERTAQMLGISVRGMRNHVNRLGLRRSDSPT